MNTPLARAVVDIMENRSIIFWLLFFVLLPEAVWAIENTNVRSPVGTGRVPLSSNRSGLIRTPNPIDTRYNLVVTGNVGGGRHFRGVVPYQSTSSLGVGSASSSLDPFLRRSGESIYTGNYSGQNQTYYSPTRTVTRTRAGQPDIIRPPASGSSGYSMGKSAAFPQVSQAKKFSYPDIMTSNIRVRPMSRTTLELEESFLIELEESIKGDEPADIKRMGRLAKFKHDVEQAVEKSAELKKELINQRKEELGEDIKQPLEAELIGKLGEDMFLDIFTQMKWQIDKLQEIADSDEEEDKQDSKRRDISKPAAKYKGISVSHKTFASLSHDRFNEHMRAAEIYLKEGKYYRAADAYTMASVYKRDDPLAYAGKSHALFAAGEYMSSALFLSRALKVFPEYAQLKIDIVTMVGSRDKLESRIVDIEEILGKVNVPELQFLLGYIYYQMGRLNKAKESIDAAYKKMSDSSAVIELRKAIFSK